MRNDGLDEAQAGVKIVGRNISNLRYAHDSTLMTESEEELNQINSLTVKKILGPTTDIPTSGSGKGTEPPGNLTLEASGI